MLIFDVEVDSYAVRRDLAGILERLGPEYVKRFLRQAGGVAKASVKASFSAGGRPSWAPLSPNTLTRRQYASKAIIGAKEHRKSHAQREVERGNRTATDKRFRRARGTTPLGGASGPFGRSISVRSVGDETVWVGPPRGLWGLFAIHAAGSARMPAREVVYLQPGDVAVIDQKAEDFVDKALGTGGLI